MGCGGFLELDDEIHRVWRLEAAYLDSCDATDDCKAVCAAEFDASTGGGDLNFVMSNGYSVGQYICLTIAEEHELFHVHRPVGVRRRLHHRRPALLPRRHLPGLLSTHTHLQADRPSFAPPAVMGRAKGDTPPSKGVLM